MPKKSPTSKSISPYYQAQDILSHRDHSVAELSLKMRRKGFSVAQISEVVDLLKSHKLLDDRRLAERYANSVLATKPVGPRWLSAKLKQKGVPAQVSESVLEELFSQKETNILINRAADYWRRIHHKAPDDLAALGRFLLSRGFLSYHVQDYLAVTRRGSLSD